MIWQGFKRIRAPRSHKGRLPAKERLFLLEAFFVHPETMISRANPQHLRTTLGTGLVLATFSSAMVEHRLTFWAETGTIGTHFMQPSFLGHGFLLVSGGKIRNFF